MRLVKKKNTHKYSCVKIMKKADLIKAQQVDHISNEYKILSSISHPFIVSSLPFRSTSQASHKTQRTSTCSWSTFQAVNYSLTFEKKACLKLIKQRKPIKYIDSTPLRSCSSFSIYTPKTSSTGISSQKIY